MKLAASKPFTGSGLGINNPLFAGGRLGSISSIVFFGKLISLLITLALIIGGVFFMFQFILGAISWISAGSDAQKVEGARAKLTNAFVGLVILLTSFAVFKIIEEIFGIKLTTIDVSSLLI